MKRLKQAGIAAVLAGGALAAGAAVAQDAMAPEAADQAVHVRHSVMTLLGWNMGPLGAMARGNAEFDIDRVKLSAERMSAVAPMIVDAFAPDTRGADVETEALDSIWESHDAFNDKAADLVDAIGGLKEAADGGDQQTVMQAVGGVGQACGACHDDYRAE